MVDIPIRECQWIGADQDPRRGPVHYCGQRPLYPGKSYCADHVWLVYAKGTGLRGKKKIKEFEENMLSSREATDD